MEELFSNILYLIPIAFFIAIRIINAKAKQSGKEQQRNDSGSLSELVKRIQEAQENPAYGKALTEDRGVFIPPRMPAPARQPEQKKKAAKKAAPPPLSEQNVLQSTLFAEASTKDDSGKTDTGQASVLRGIRPGWTPLQQAVVWSEILGTPKGA